MQVTRPEIDGWFGAAASSHSTASAVAMGVLERGGNAFDAAVAGGLALQALCPHLNGPGGDLALIYHAAEDARTVSLCGQGPTPAALTAERLQTLGLDAPPGAGLLPAVVPGAFDAWMRLLAERGRMTLAEVLAPAIAYADRGVPVDRRLHDTLAAAQPIFLRYWPDSAALYLVRGEAPAIGGLLANPTLAATYRRLLAEAESAGAGRLVQIEAARRAWSDGFVAEAVDRFCRTAEAMDVSGRVHQALLTGADLAGWRAPEEPTIARRYAGLTLHKCGPWTQGPVLLQTLALLPAEEMAALDPLGAPFVHRVAEALKLAFADRETFYGVDGPLAAPIDRLLSDDYAVSRAALIGDQADNSWRPGEIDGAGAPIDYAAAAARRRESGLLAAYGGGEPTTSPAFAHPAYRSRAVGDTCHIDVTDGDGNMVSATPSGGWLQSSPAIPTLGFPLGTRAQMMWPDPASPSGLGPRRRPRTTLSPTLGLDGEGRPTLSCGTPGGDQQDQWQAIFLIRRLVHKMGLQEAIEAPSFHSEHHPNSFYPRAAAPGRLVVEGRFSEEAIADLSARGHAVEAGGDWSEGRLTAIERSADGRLKAAASPRGGLGYAVGR
ncbi:MAG: gamma-glutamyltransferase [Marivibrio sp.]|uniref:gamma-glutamyltransferase family protein n=1 Tax=Marivibrio sp. TaxID=2039719 RepID=UPI0032EB6FA8